MNQKHNQYRQAVETRETHVWTPARSCGMVTHCASVPNLQWALRRLPLAIQTVRSSSRHCLSFLKCTMLCTVVSRAQMGPLHYANKNKMIFSLYKKQQKKERGIKSDLLEVSHLFHLINWQYIKTHFFPIKNGSKCVL